MLPILCCTNMKVTCLMRKKDAHKQFLQKSLKDNWSPEFVDPSLRNSYLQHALVPRPFCRWGGGIGKRPWKRGCLQRCKLFTKNTSSFESPPHFVSFDFRLFLIWETGGVAWRHWAQRWRVDFFCFFAPCFFVFLAIPGSVISRNRTVCIWATFWTRIRIRLRRARHLRNYRMVSMY